MEENAIVDAVQFGNFLLSAEREASIRENPDFKAGELTEERLRVVHHADVENFKAHQQQ